MVVDAAGDVYLTDTDGKRHSQIVELSKAGVIVARWQHFVWKPDARNGPEGIAMTRSGSLLVTDGGDSQILELTPELNRSAVFARSVKFADLGHIAVGHDSIYVSEGPPRTILKLTPGGKLVERWHRAKGREATEWSFPETIAIQPTGNLVVEDWANRRIEILSPLGVTLALFGSAGHGDGQFLNTAGVNVDSRGNIYVADAGLHRLQEFNTEGRFIRVIGRQAGRAIFREGPSSVAIGPSGIIYAADGLTIVRLNHDGKLISRWN